MATTIDTGAPVLAIEVSPDSRYVTTSGGQQVKFWDSTTFAPAKEATFEFEVECAALSPSSKYFAVGGTDMWVHLHSFDTLEEVDTGKGHHGPVHSVQFAPDGDSYASGSEDGTIRIWQIPGVGGSADDVAKGVESLNVAGAAGANNSA